MSNGIQEQSRLELFPQSGWWPMSRYLVALEMEREQFLYSARKMRIPYKKFGNERLYHAETFLDRLETEGTEDGEET